MKRKSVLLALVVLLAALGVAATLFLAVRHEPKFYVEAIEPPGPEREHLGTKFFSDFAQFSLDVSSNREWRGAFDEKCINAWLDDQLVSSGFASKLPEGITAPRIAIAPEKMRLAFQYKIGPLSTIVSIDMRPWVPAQQLNVVALELQALHAGSLPISAQSLLESVSEKARENNIEVTWYRYDGHPVALLRFQADQDRPTYRLDQLVLKKGTLEVSGRSIEPVPLRLTSLERPAPAE
jgi:hypothetical protein